MARLSRTKQMPHNQLQVSRKAEEMNLRKAMDVGNQESADTLIAQQATSARRSTRKRQLSAKLRTDHTSPDAKRSRQNPEGSSQLAVYTSNDHVGDLSSDIAHLTSEHTNTEMEVVSLNNQSAAAVSEAQELPSENAPLQHTVSINEVRDSGRYTERQPLAYSSKIESPDAMTKTGISLETMLTQIVDSQTPNDTARSLMESIIIDARRVVDTQTRIAEVIYYHLHGNERFQELGRLYPDVMKAFDSILQTGQKGFKSRQNMNDNIRKMREFMGRNFFDAFLFDEMTPWLAQNLWDVCKWMYNNNIPTTEWVDLLNRIRGQRLQGGPRIGVSIVSNLQAVDCVRLKEMIQTGIESGRITFDLDQGITSQIRDLLPPVSSEFLEEHNRAMQASDKQLVTLDKRNFLHLGSDVPDILKDKDIPEFPSALKGRWKTTRGPKPRRITPDIRQLLYKIQTDKADPIRTASSGEVGTSNVTQGDGVEVDAQNHGGADDDSRIAGDHPGTNALGTSKVDLRAADAEIASTTARTRAWFDGTNGYRVNRGRQKYSLGLVSPNRFTGAQFGIESWLVSASARMAPFIIAKQLHTALFSEPSDLEKQVLNWSQSVARNFEDPSVPILDIATEVSNARRSHEFTAMLQRLDSAIMPPCNVDGKNSILKASILPYISILTAFTTLHTVQLLDATRPPLYVEVVRAMIAEVVEHYGEGYSEHVKLGETPSKNSILLRPDAMTMDQFVDGPGTRGWLGGNTLLVAMQFMLKDKSKVQVLDGDHLVDFVVRKFGDSHRPHRIDFPRYASTINHPIVMAPFNPLINHWLLLVMDFEAREWSVLDSRGNGNGHEEYVHRTIREMGTDPTTWRRTRLRSIRQENTSDCGFWVIANAVAYAKTGRAAGPQSTGNLRTWVARILSQALLNQESPRGASSRPAEWLTVDMATAVDLAADDAAESFRSSKETADLVMQEPTAACVKEACTQTDNDWQVAKAIADGVETTTEEMQAEHEDDGAFSAGIAFAPNSDVARTPNRVSDSSVRKGKGMVAIELENKTPTPTPDLNLQQSSGSKDTSEEHQVEHNILQDALNDLHPPESSSLSRSTRISATPNHKLGPETLPNNVKSVTTSTLGPGSLTPQWQNKQHTQSSIDRKDTYDFDDGSVASSASKGMSRSGTPGSVRKRKRVRKLGLARRMEKSWE